MTCDHSPFYEAFDSEAAVMVFKNPDFREAAKINIFLGIIPEPVNRHPLGTFRILLSLFAEKVVFFLRQKSHILGSLGISDPHPSYLGIIPKNTCVCFGASLMPSHGFSCQQTHSQIFKCPIV